MARNHSFILWNVYFQEQEVTLDFSLQSKDNVKTNRLELILGAKNLGLCVDDQDGKKLN